MNFPPLVDTTKASINADLILLLFTIWYLDVQIDPLKKISRPFSYHNFGLFVGFSWLLWVAIAKPELSLQTIVNLLVFEFKLWPEYNSSPCYAVFFCSLFSKWKLNPSILFVQCWAILHFNLPIFPWLNHSFSKFSHLTQLRKTP